MNTKNVLDRLQKFGESTEAIQKLENDIAEKGLDSAVAMYLADKSYEEIFKLSFGIIGSYNSRKKDFHLIARDMLHELSLVHPELTMIPVLLEKAAHDDSYNVIGDIIALPFKDKHRVDVARRNFLTNHFRALAEENFPPKA